MITMMMAQVFIQAILLCGILYLVARHEGRTYRWRLRKVAASGVTLDPLPFPEGE